MYLLEAKPGCSQMACRISSWTAEITQLTSWFEHCGSWKTLISDLGNDWSRNDWSVDQVQLKDMMHGQRTASKHDTTCQLEVVLTLTHSLAVYATYLPHVFSYRANCRIHTMMPTTLQQPGYSVLKQLALYYHLSHAQSDVHLVVILAFAPFMVHRCSYPHGYCSVYSQTNVYVQRPNYLKL